MVEQLAALRVEHHEGGRTRYSKPKKGSGFDDIADVLALLVEQAVRLAPSGDVQRRTDLGIGRTSTLGRDPQLLRARDQRYRVEIAPPPGSPEWGDWAVNLLAQGSARPTSNAGSRRTLSRAGEIRDCAAAGLAGSGRAIPGRMPRRMGLNIPIRR